MQDAELEVRLLGLHTLVQYIILAVGRVRVAAGTIRALMTIRRACDS